MSVGVDEPSQVMFVTDVYAEAVAAKAAGKCIGVISIVGLSLFFLLFVDCLSINGYRFILWQFLVSLSNSYLFWSKLQLVDDTGDSIILLES